MDTTRSDVDLHRILGTALDIPVTDRLIWETYRYAGLLKAPVAADLEPTAQGVASNLALPFAQLTYAYEGRGDQQQAIRNLERASLLSPNPALKRALLNLVTLPGADSAVAP